MTQTSAERAQRRARWRSYFEQTLLGPDSEIEAATEAAMQAVARGEKQAGIIAAGRSAAADARAARNGGTATPRPRPAASSTPSTPRSSTPSAPSAARSSTPSASPSAARAATPSSAPPDATSPTSARVWPAGSGVVYGLQQRTESLDGQFFQVWSFRLLRLEGGRTPVQPPIPVELRGRAIIGQLAKGDVVEIPGGSPGHVRIVKKLRNHTTQTVIEARGRPFRRTRTIARTIKLATGVIAGVVGAALLVIILILVIGGFANIGS